MVLEANVTCSFCGGDRASCDFILAKEPHYLCSNCVRIAAVSIEQAKAAAKRQRVAQAIVDALPRAQDTEHKLALILATLEYVT
jgi:hypothetical protein